MVKPEWGIKRLCQSCGSRYYDFLRTPIVCPNCGTTFDSEAVLKSRRARPLPPDDTKPKVRKEADAEVEELDAEDEEELDEEEESLDEDEIDEDEIEDGDEEAEPKGKRLPVDELDVEDEDVDDVPVEEEDDLAPIDEDEEDAEPDEEDR